MIVFLLVVLEPKQYLALINLVSFLDEQLDRRVACAGLDLNSDLGLKGGGTLKDRLDHPSLYFSQFHQHSLFFLRLAGFFLSSLSALF